VALPLPGTNVAVLFDNCAHPLPETVSVGEAMHRSQYIVSQIGKEKERIIVAIFECELLLVGKTVEDLVDESRNLGSQGAIGLKATFPVQNRQQEGY
jgi:hypothetical protein